MANTTAAADAAAPKKIATTMEELLASAETPVVIPKHGDVIEGIVTDVTKKAVLVDIGGKTEGIITDKEFETSKEYVEKLNPGDKVPVYVVSVENDRGQILLSLKKAVQNQKWEQFEQAAKTEEVLTVKGIELNRGGMIAGVDGVRGFIPTSQFSKQLTGKLESLIDQPIKVKVIEVDREKNRLIFSERNVSEAQLVAQKAAILDALQADQMFDGTVTGVMSFGVFVAISVPLAGEKEPGRIEGLVHISEISWEKVEDPSKMFKVGDAVKVKVVSFDKETGKLNLSIKRMSDDPWVIVAQKYVEGTTVTGTVSRIAPFGVFVNLEPGVDGLIHISKLQGGSEPKPGEKITVSVEKVEPEARRMRLGIVLTELPVGYK